jgi:hypothetical protein
VNNFCLGITVNAVCSLELPYETQISPSSTVAVSSVRSTRLLRSVLLPIPELQRNPHHNVFAYVTKPT